MIYLPLSGTEVSLWALILIGFTAGVCGGFFGIGGAWLVTPALNIFGLPMAYAIGTGLAFVIGTSVVATIGHWRLGNLDVKLGLLLIASGLPGVELGKRLVIYLEQIGQVGPVVRLVYILMLAGVGIYMLREYLTVTRKQGSQGTGSDGTTPLATWIRARNICPRIALPRSGITAVPVWPLLLIGLGTGFLSGLLGVGGGLVLVPALLYIVGCPTTVAVGTSLFLVVFSSSYGAFSYAVEARVELIGAAIMLIAGAAGVQFGTTATKYVRGTHLRLYFSITTLLAAVAIVMKQLSTVLDTAALNSWAAYLVLGTATGMSLIITASLARGMVTRRQSGRSAKG